MASPVTYELLECRTVLNKSTSKRNRTFFWTLNPYRGCQFGCVYCFARYTHTFFDLHNPRDFERRIFVKHNAPRVLAETVADRHLVGRPVLLGSATDPWQPAERKFEVTRRILEVLRRYPNLTLRILTKSGLICRDIDLLSELGARVPVSVGISLPTVDRPLARKLEPVAPTPEVRLRTLRALSDAGLHAGVMAMPVLAGITDNDAHLEDLFSSARDAGAKFITAGALSLYSASRKSFFPFLRREFPDLWRDYWPVYKDSAYQTNAYSKTLAERVGALKERHGFTIELASRPKPPRPGTQLTLTL